MSWQDKMYVNLLRRGYTPWVAGKIIDNERDKRKMKKKKKDKQLTLIGLMVIVAISTPARAKDNAQWEVIHGLPTPGILESDTSIDRIKLVKEQVNKNFKYEKEKIDVWKTPAQFIKDDGGDCEDFAIYTAFELMRYGFKREDMELMIGNYKGEYHAVLLLKKNDDKIIIDNTHKDAMYDWMFMYNDDGKIFEPLKIYEF